MSTLYIKIQFFFHSLRNQIESRSLQLGCHFFSSWFLINNDCICTTGKVLKLDGIYTYKDGDNVEIVRLTNVHTERRYQYCSLFFFSMNKIITVRQTMLKGAPILWSLLNNIEFDELMSIKLWNDFSKEVELLEFDF
jgi:hypothetical protein